MSLLFMRTRFALQRLDCAGGARSRSMSSEAPIMLKPMTMKVSMKASTA